MSQKLEDIGKYIVHLDNQMGNGSFGVVYKCHKKGQPQEEYCAKYINMSKGASILEGEKTSYQQLSQIKSENLVQLYDMIELKDYLIIIMELCSHDLNKEFKNMKQKGQWFSQNEQIDIIRQILNGAKALSDYKIIHRDIKPQNMLVKIVQTGNSQKKIYKISDFGFCQKLENKYRLSNFLRVGTQSYFAPEMQYNKTYNAKCDIYSYGLVFYQIINQGDLPQIPDSQVRNFQQNKKTDPFKCPQPIPGKHGQLLTQLLESMIVLSVDDRISYEELFNSRIFTEIYQIQEESLFLMQDEKPITQNNLQIIQSNQQKRQERVQRTYLIQEIFFRKYLLCKHVDEYLSQNIFLQDLKNMALQQLISQIGLQQITFAFAACKLLLHDLHGVFKDESNNMVKLLNVFKDYCEKSKNDEKFQIQQQKIKSAYYLQLLICKQQFDQFLKQLQKDQQSQFFKKTIFEKLATRKVDINDLCEELAIKKKELEREGWFQKLPNCEKENVQKVCEIEREKFHVINYQFVELDEIIKI